jgi:hypothetical protein
VTFDAKDTLNEERGESLGPLTPPPLLFHCSTTTQQQTSQNSSLSPQHDSNTWLDGLNSPLIQDEGDNKKLKLRFDVSQYTPEEIVVKTVDNKLLVSNSCAPSRPPPSPISPPLNQPNDELKLARLYHNRLTLKSSAVFFFTLSLPFLILLLPLLPLLPLPLPLLLLFLFFSSYLIDLSIRVL